MIQKLDYIQYFSDWLVESAKIPPATINEKHVLCRLFVVFQEIAHEHYGHHWYHGWSMPWIMGFTEGQATARPLDLTLVKFVWI